MKFIGQNQIATGVLAAAVGLGKGLTNDLPPNGCDVALVFAETQGLRLMPGGAVDPTASLGIPIPAGGCYQLFGIEISTAKIIRQASNAVASVFFYKDDGPGGTALPISGAAALSAGSASIGTVGLNAGEAHVGAVGGNGVLVSTSFARPADGAAYAANDAVSNSTSAPTVLTFTNVARVAQGTGVIVKARLWTDQAANVARFRLHLYHTTPTPVNDNAQQTVLWANRSKKIGVVTFDACRTEGTGSDAAYSQRVSDGVSLPLHFACDAADRNIYGLLETLDAFTPTSGQNFFLELDAELD